jgi:AraC family transcriptional regulator, arabinose operon regulatory protein
MKPPRPLTPFVPANPLRCSEFREGRDYTNWRPGGSGDWLLIYTMDGGGRIGGDAESRRLRAGDAALFAPGAVQDYSTDRTCGFWHLRWAHFVPRPHWRVWLPWPGTTGGVGRLELRGQAALAVAGALERMLIADRLGGVGHEELAMAALEEALIWTYRIAVQAPFSRVNPRVQKAARYLASHPSEPFKLSTLAEHCGLSVSRLGHLFRAELNATPHQYSERLRLDYAQQLLRQTDLPIARIAEEVGFADALYFSRRFRRLRGATPSGFRAHSRREVQA